MKPCSRQHTQYSSEPWLQNMQVAPIELALIPWREEPAVVPRVGHPAGIDELQVVDVFLRAKKKKKK